MPLFFVRKNLLLAAALAAVIFPETDMSSGVIFGVKLPTGDCHTAGFDSDTQIGTHSYARALIAPGMALSHSDGWKLYADVEIPAWQHVAGDQLIAPVAFKVIVSHSF